MKDQNTKQRKQFIDNPHGDRIGVKAIVFASIIIGTICIVLSLIVG